MFTAYCYLEGDIHFGEKVPSGAIAIMKGLESKIRKIVKENCTIGYFSGEEAPFIEAVNAANKLPSKNQIKQGDALGFWLDEMSNKYQDSPVYFTVMKDTPR